jgi:hypothetical protein
MIIAIAAIARSPLDGTSHMCQGESLLPGAGHSFLPSLLPPLPGPPGLPGQVRLHAKAACAIVSRTHQPRRWTSGAR